MLLGPLKKQNKVDGILVIHSTKAISLHLAIKFFIIYFFKRSQVKNKKFEDYNTGVIIL